MKKAVKILHLVSACLWLGASASVVMLQCARGWSADSGQLLALNQSFSLLDLVLIIPGALGSALTGFIICRTTSWGFLRYRWIIVKGVLTIGAILVGTALLGPWQIRMVTLSTQPENELIIGGSYDLIRALFMLVGSIQVAMLLFILALSVLKPWGRYIPRQNEARLVKDGIQRAA